MKSLTLSFLYYTAAIFPLGLLPIFALIMANDNKLQNIIAHCKEYGFVFQSSEIYSPMPGFYDYGPLGTYLCSYDIDTYIDYYIYSTLGI